MSWPSYPWTDKTAAELRPVIVALCNAVGDRYECIGMNRPAWPVNVDQAVDSYTAGTKSATLIEDDLYATEIFRTGWWTLIADHIKTLVNMASGSNSSMGATQCRGWSKTSTSSGIDSDVWTLADLETDVALGEVDEGTMHLFDEVVPNRLRQFLDRLIYPVIFPLNIVQSSSGGGTYTLTGLSSGAVSGIEAHSYRGESPTGDGDDAWGALALEPLNFWSTGVAVGFNVAMPFLTYSEAYSLDLSYVAFSFESSQNGIGCLGEVTRAIFGLFSSGADFSSFDITVASGVSSFGASGHTSIDVYQVVDGDTSLTITGVDELPFTIDNYGRTPSPGTYEGEGGFSPPIGFEGYGRMRANVLTLFAGGGATRDQCTRYILDISANCSDQT